MYKQLALLFFKQVSSSLLLEHVTTGKTKNLMTIYNVTITDINHSQMLDKKIKIKKKKKKDMALQAWEAAIRV